MDAPTANQSQTFCHMWVGQQGWSSPPCTPLPSLQHLTLHSPTDQRPCYDHSQASTKGTLQVNDAQHIEHHPHVSSVGSAAEGPKNMPPAYLPDLCEGPQPYTTNQTPPNSNYSQYKAMPPPFLLPHTTHQMSQNGAWSPHEEHMPISPGVPGPDPHRYPPCSPYVKSPASPTSPLHQPPEVFSSHYIGNINTSVPSWNDCDITTQPPNSSWSRYGLNPELLPSAVKVIAEDQAEWEDKIFVSEPFCQLPPLATTSYSVEDRGNASPLAIRSTTYCVPCEGQVALLSRLPLGALVTPLAKQSAAENPLQVCEEPQCMKGCRWCGAFMCPAMGWLDCGQRFHCPFCDKLTEVPWQHYQPTNGAEGARVDKDKRPELSMGSYEILGSQKGDPAALILAIDVSAPALRGGHLEFLTQQLLNLLASPKREDGDALSDVRVGLMTYDTRVHLYDLSPALSRPHMLVITDAEDLQLPVREGLLVPLRDCVDGLSSVLQLLPQFSPEAEDSGGVPPEMPVKAGLAVLQELSCPGKMLIFHTAPLVETDPSNVSSGFFGSSKPKSIFQPSDRALSLAKECVRQGCGVHMFVLAQQDVGGAWPGHIPYLTGGALHSYNQLQGELDRERFSCDLRRTATRDTAYKADLRVFVSKDLRVSGCYGLFIPGPDPGRVAMATMDQFTTQAVELAHSRGLEETRGVTVQAVLSYSTQAGDRRTRVHTLTLRCSRHLQDVFRQYQAQTLLTFYCKKIYCAVLERPLQELREELQTDVTEALASYRKHSRSSSVSPGQLVLPQHLRALPVYVNSLRKSDVLLPGLRTSVHQRLQQRCQVLAMDPLCASTHFYPLLLPLPLSGDDLEPPNPGVALRCSTTSLKPAGLYLVHAPLTLLLWVGAQVPACALVQLFNTNCFFSLSSGETKLPVLQNPLSISIRALIDRLNTQVPHTRKLWVVKQGDACEEALQRHLVEDKSPNGGASYADFLYHLHVNSVRLLQ